MNRSSRANIASETLSILDAGYYRAPGGGEIDINSLLQSCAEETRLYEPRELKNIYDQVTGSPGYDYDTDIEVVNESTLQGVFHLCERMSGNRVGALNFASARNPGGGFLKGSQAQEESLARSSGLYKSLIQCPQYYEYHRHNPSPLYSHRMIYSPDCPVFRNDQGALLAKPCLVDFITSAAPNAGVVRTRQPEKVDQIGEVLSARIALFLGLALHRQVTDLVLGAWGCGVFKNDPTDVASAFGEFLKQGGPFYRSFRKIRFSVLDRSRGQKSFKVFKGVF